jgi:hypothetical protein
MPDEAPPTLDYASRRNTNPPPDDTLRCALPSRPMRRATLICMLLALASVIALLPAVILANVTLGSNAGALRHRDGLRQRLRRHVRERDDRAER